MEESLHESFCFLFYFPRKAAKRELLPCDFPGCGRIFSNRQYLNVRDVRDTGLGSL